MPARPTARHITAHISNFTASRASDRSRAASATCTYGYEERTCGAAQLSTARAAVRRAADTDSAWAASVPRRATARTCGTQQKH